MYLVTSEQMQAIDKRTIEQLNVPGIVLMANAGKEAATIVAAKGPKRVCIVCGKGNNGGDGWIAAWWLKHAGTDVQVLSTIDASALAGDARTASNMAQGLGVPYEVYQPGMEMPHADVYVDAILGTGSRAELSPLYAELVSHLNDSSSCTISIDIPTGINADTGEVPGVAVRAAETVCIGHQKLGTAITPGSTYAGRIHVVDIGFDDTPFEPTAESVTAEQIARWLPVRGNETHKGSFGRVGIVVGEMPGAAVLAGLGAHRVGAGLVMLSHPTPVIPHAPYEFVLRLQDQSDVLANFRDCQALVLGPGLGQQVETWANAMSRYEGLGVLDAEGLTILTRESFTGLRENHWVLTPHPKECARILNWSVPEVQARRLEAAKQVAVQTRSIVVLKGYQTVIATPEGRVRVNPTGDASLATAGTGDVLAGMIGSLIAQGLSLFDAAAGGAWIHGMAGELAGQARSKTSTMASDVVEFISRAISLYFDAKPQG